MRMKHYGWRIHKNISEQNMVLHMNDLRLAHLCLCWLMPYYSALFLYFPFIDYLYLYRFSNLKWCKLIGTVVCISRHRLRLPREGNWTNQMASAPPCLRDRLKFFGKNPKGGPGKFWIKLGGAKFLGGAERLWLKL